MTRDEIISMAREAGAAQFYPEQQSKKADSYLVGQAFLERFAALVAAKEREACEVLCDELPLPSEFQRAGAAAWERGTNDCARAIRARGQQA